MGGVEVKVSVAVVAVDGRLVREVRSGLVERELSSAAVGGRDERDVVLPAMGRTIVLRDNAEEREGDSHQPVHGVVGGRVASSAIEAKGRTEYGQWLRRPTMYYWQW